MRRKIFTYFGLLLLLVVAIVGIYLTASTFRQTRNQIYDEHDGHLMNLADTVDTNVANLLDRCYVELEAMTEDPWIQEAETLYHQTGNSDKLLFEIQNSFLLRTDLVDRVIVLEGDRVVLCSSCLDHCDFSFLPDSDGDTLWLCTEQGQYYLAFTMPAQDGSLTYAVLVKPTAFFERAVSSSIYTNYWITIVDMGSGFSMQNGTDQALIVMIPPEEMAAREDGYSVIYDSWRSGESRLATYRYIYNDGRDTQQRIAVIPKTLTANKIFNIGIAVDLAHIVVPTAQMATRVSLYTAIIGFCIATMALLIFITNKKSTLLTQQVATLETEKQIATELLERQTQLAHNQRLEYVGLLTSSVSHEVNNLLTPIMGYSLMLLESIPDDSDNYDSVLEIYNASLRARSLIERLSNFSRKQGKRQVRKVPLSHIVGDTLTIASPLQPKNIKVLKELEADVSLECEETQMIQVLLNLVMNGFQAMTPQGGTLSIASSATDREVIIKVTDTGTGISQENLKKIFDPFYTSKGSGIGLGLPIVQQIMEQYGGNISVDSVEGVGSTFTIRFPLGNE